MEITEKISATGASEDELQALERRLNATLPQDYRRFLKRVNGGRPNPRQFEGPTGDGSVIHFFFTLDHRSKYYQIVEEIQAFVDRIPPKTLPIACDPFGNLVLLDIGAKSAGAIYFWEHENENMEGDPWWDNISYIAPSFSDFVDSLH